MNTRIAITGPDGAGKTTICEQMAERLPKVRILYGGKARNHTLATTGFAYKVMAQAQELWAPLYFPFRYFWFYIFEYFENRNRFLKLEDSSVDYMIYDRHPIDRMVLPADINLKLEHGRVSKTRWMLETLPRRFWAWVYRKNFDAPVIVFVLLPTAELCHERSSGQYKQILDASIRIDSYQKTIPQLRPTERYIPIKITPEVTVDTVCDIIQSHLSKMTHS